MIELRPFATLGHLEIDWLDARYHFSFAGYRDPARMGFGVLRVWNDDRIRAGGGFDFHGHSGWEIVTYVRRGAVTHLDSLGHEDRLPAKGVQVMSAGTGIVHAEFNREPGNTEVFQIWVRSADPGGEPFWASRVEPEPEGEDAPWIRRRVSGAGSVPAVLPVRQDVTLYDFRVPAGSRLVLPVRRGRRAYFVADRGRGLVGDVAFAARDGVAVADEEELALDAEETLEGVLVEMP